MRYGGIGEDRKIGGQDRKYTRSFFFRHVGKCEEVWDTRIWIAKVGGLLTKSLERIRMCDRRSKPSVKHGKTDLTTLPVIGKTCIAISIGPIDHLGNEIVDKGAECGLGLRSKTSRLVVCQRSARKESRSDQANIEIPVRAWWRN